MSTTLPPSKPAPPPAAKRPSPANTQAPVSTRDFQVSSGTKLGAEKVVVFSSGGAGKTSLAALIQEAGVKPLFLDIEQGSARCDVSRIDTIETWGELRAILQNQSLLEPYNAVVVDSLTKAEEMAIAWTLQNVKHEKGHYVESIEGYGFGKGFTHVYETFLQLLGDLDAVARSGLHVICTAHECVANVPNPSGEDWIRYEPRLQSPASGKASIRHRVKEWCDHLLYIGFDTAVSKDGKASGSGTRTIYPTEMPWCWAKSRSLSDPIPYTKGDAELWHQLLGK